MFVLAACLGATAISGYAQDPPRRTAVRLDPTSVILDAFTSHSVVALGEGSHGNLLGHAFRLALIRDPRFTAVVNDIVVESGSATHQSLMDRYVRGDTVPESALREVRENTVTPTPAWDRPMFDEFFQAVRDLNRSLPRERQVRILLGDPPIDWSCSHERRRLSQDSPSTRLASSRPDSPRGAGQRTTGAGDLRRRALPGKNRTPGPVTCRHPRDRRHQGLQHHQYIHRPLALPVGCGLVAHAGSGLAQGNPHRRCALRGILRATTTSSSTSRRTQTSRITTTPCWCSASPPRCVWGPSRIRAARSLPTCRCGSGGWC